jgi:RES domain
MKALFAQITLAVVDRDVARNIVSFREPQNVFDDLSEHADEWKVAEQVQDEVGLPLYRSKTPIIDRPFEDANWLNAIHWPFKNNQQSRFSDGTFGVWYGSETIETTVYESAFHWYSGLLNDAGFEREVVVSERKIYSVACAASLLDCRKAVSAFPELLHPSDYSFTHSVGARIHHEGHPGLLIQSVRRPDGENVAVFNPAVLSKPRVIGDLTYKLNRDYIVVEKHPGKAWMSLDVNELKK